MDFSTCSRGPKRMLSMSRYSSIASSSSRSVTKCSWLRSSRRSSPDSFTISIRAVSGFDRISDEIDVSVLKRKCGIDLAGERFDAGRHQQLLLLLQPVLDPGAVPDLDRHGDAQDGGEDHQRHQPGVRRRVVEDAFRLVEPAAEELADDLEPDRRGQQDHHPVDLEAAHQAPHVAVEIGEEQRREMPDGFLRADLAQAAAGEAAPDGERQGNPFTGDERRHAHHRPHDRAGIGAGQKAREERAGERQIGGVVVEEQAREHAGRQWKAEAARENQPLRPIPLLGQQNPSKPGKPHQHGCQHRHDGELCHQWSAGTAQASAACSGAACMS